MKSDALQALRRKLLADQPVYGMWVTLESPSITEMAVVLGLDWVVVDAEHGHLDWKEIVEHIRDAVRSQTVVLVRVAESNVGLIKRALDLGADGVVLPWIETAEQLRQAVSFALYPPQGVRGIGGERATCWGQDGAHGHKGKKGGKSGAHRKDGEHGKKGGKSGEHRKDGDRRNDKAGDNGR